MLFPLHSSSHLYPSQPVSKEMSECARYSQSVSVNCSMATLQIILQSAVCFTE